LPVGQTYLLVPPQDPSGDTTPLGVEPAEDATDEGRIDDAAEAELGRTEEALARAEDTTPPSRLVRYQLEAGSPKHSPTGTAVLFLISFVVT
jgi:hypothetical protein